MSTNTTEKPDNTTTPETVPTENKKIFGPLGKYAIVAVIMVSIIVTTAIMLNKQLGSVDKQLAVIENEVAQLSTATDEETTATTPVVAESASADEAAAVTAAQEATPAVETTPSQINVAQQEAATDASPADTVDETTAVTSNMSSRYMQFTAESQARIDAYKSEQKQHMTEMFDRIKKLEAQQLTQYKESQDKHVERLRQQIAEQQEIIDALILRNKESLQMREASMKKHQTSREEMLNRI